MTDNTPISPIERAPHEHGMRPAALDGYSLKIVGWRPVTGEA